MCIRHLGTRAAYTTAIVICRYIPCLYEGCGILSSFIVKIVKKKSDDKTLWYSLTANDGTNYVLLLNLIL